MTLRIRVALAIATVLATVGAHTQLAAQADTTRATAGDSIVLLREPDQTPPPSATNLALADTLLIVLRSEATMNAARTAQFDAIVRQQPALARVRDVFDTWAARYLTWDAIGPSIAQVYAREFTEDDLRSFIAFYRTPAGQKLVAKLPEILRQTTDLGAALGAKHQAELQSMILSRLAPASDTTH